MPARVALFLFSLVPQDMATCRTAIKESAKMHVGTLVDGFLRQHFENTADEVSIHHDVVALLVAFVAFSDEVTWEVLKRWISHFGYQSRGDLPVFLQCAADLYDECMGEDSEQRPLWTQDALNFVKQDLLPRLAQQRKQLLQDMMISVEMFADFCAYWHTLWSTMSDTELRRCYLKRVSVFAGLMPRAEAMRIIAGYDPHTFLLLFSKRDPKALTLVVSKGIGLKPSLHKITIVSDAESQKACYEVLMRSRGQQRFQSLYDLFLCMPNAQYLWYRTSGQQAGHVIHNTARFLTKVLHWRRKQDYVFADDEIALASVKPSMCLLE